ncbi:pyridoxal-dependent decarboxylase [Amycolatopsis pithecellobii]|uniref:Aminotransferase class V-fold PLP-dependent enzyme n=1 Tax=Amycolatopsis pithecellobii TaxID=664692 RepID=A0A6N7YYG0_9PSEU|nr:pyridoxal-dependent decarboxylase [Amycolatopsis pithecellobii]MTD53933.1 aminotransferase class V-fold PLP-dependent enzyme [Amycolatopsis pithecellobii]
MGDSTALAGGPQGHERLAELIPLVLQGIATGAAERAAPGPAGGPAPVAASVAALEPLVPARGVGAEQALSELSTLLAAGSVDPADPWCAAHLHTPPLAVGVAADVAAGALNPSMDSWDQAPVASELERAFLATIARLCYPDEAGPDAVVTTGGTESNLLGLLLAREQNPAVRPVCGRNAHHSVARAAWLLGLPVPLVVEGERMDPYALDTVLAETGPAVVVATAGTTDTGDIDPLRDLARICHRHAARLHVDASYGGLALCSTKLRPLLDGIDGADSIALDLHKFGWQSVAAGLFATKKAVDLKALTVSAEYLNAEDDTEAGLPDLLGRSIRTSRRPDAFRMAVTMRALGIEGMGELVERCCATAREVADAIRGYPTLELWGEPALSTVLFRPRFGDAAHVRRRLLEAGTAIIGRATMPPGEVWLKLTLLHPHATAADYLGLLDATVAAVHAPEGAVAS